MKPLDLNFPAKTEGGEAALHPLAMKLVGHAERQERMIRTLAGKIGQRPEAPPTFAEERRLAAELARRPADAVELERQRVLQRALDEVYFRAELNSGNAVYYFGAATAANGSADVMAFPDAAATIASTTTAERELWVRTRPRVTVRYTSPVGSVATFDLQFLLIFLGAGGTTAGVTRTATWSPAGPAVAGTIVESQFVLTGGVTPSSPYGDVRLALIRFGNTDANVNQLDVISAVVTFEEVA